MSKSSMRAMRMAIITIGLPIGLAMLGGVAVAETRQRCGEVDADAIAVDGMLDDWQGAPRARIGGGDRDASLDVRCVVESALPSTKAGRLLAMSFDVRDEHVVRSAVAVGPGDDRLEVRLA